MILKTFLVVLILLLVLALNNLLSFLGYTVELNIKSALLVVFYLELLALHYVLDLLQFSLVSQNLHHLLNFAAPFRSDVIVLNVNDGFFDEYGIFVVGGDWELWHLNLTLLQEDHSLEIELELLLAITGLLIAHLSVLKLLYKLLLTLFKVHNERT